MKAIPITLRPRIWYRLTTVTAIPVFLAAPLTMLDGQAHVHPTQNALAGAQIYGAKGCVKCHAINGLGGTEGPDLARSPSQRTFYDLAASMWNHRPQMGARMHELGIRRPDLSPQETGDLIAFLYTLDYFEAPGDADRGKQLFADKRCIVCHQVGGAGGAVGPNLGAEQFVAPIEFATAMWNHGPEMAEAMRANGIDRPRFNRAELADLIAFLEAESSHLPVRPLNVLPGEVSWGRRVFVGKGCAQCHSVGGEGANVGPDLAQRSDYRSLLGFAAAMWNKEPAMLRAMNAKGMSAPRLRPEEMADLIGYLYSVQYFAESGTSVRGRRLVRRNGCLECHGLSGQGASSATDLGTLTTEVTPASVISALWNHAFLEDGSTIEMSSWPAFGPGEMADLTAFLQSVSRPR